MDDQDSGVGRRAVLGLGVVAASGLSAGAASAQQQDLSLGDMTVLDPLKPELVMNLVVTCSNFELPGPSAEAPDGRREKIWPIIGGRFEGPGIRGEVIPGGGDFPVIRPDGVTIIDALYRLRTDDGTTIIIHNKGISIGPAKYRLVPQFTVTAGKYDWLNKGVFISTLVRAVPEKMRLAKGPDQNDRLIQIHRIG